jgi:hypothetical protein
LPQVLDLIKPVRVEFPELDIGLDIRYKAKFDPEQFACSIKNIRFLIEYAIEKNKIAEKTKLEQMDKDLSEFMEKVLNLY